MVISEAKCLFQWLIDRYCCTYQYGLSLSYKIPLLQLGDYAVRQCSVVNIVGGGASSIETLRFTSESDAFITCNLAVAQMSDWDFVFIEYDKHRAYRESLYQGLAGTNIKNLVLKNNYLHGPLKCFDYYSGLNNSCRVSILRESQALFGFGIIERAIRSAFQGGSPFIHQYASSVFVMILFASLYRPKKIILHGFDFGGPSFYQTERFSAFDPGQFSNASSKGRSRSGVSIRNELNMVRTVLKEYGVIMEFAK